MEIGSIIFWAVVAVLIVYAISIYNHLVRLKHNVSKAWSNIDVLLKQRHDEIPKLVETCKQYMQYEQDTLEKVMQARAQVSQAREAQDVAGLGIAEGALRMGLGQLFALLGDAKSAGEARQLEQEIWEIWFESKSPNAVDSLNQARGVAQAGAVKRISWFEWYRRK